MDEAYKQKLSTHVHSTLLYDFGFAVSDTHMNTMLYCQYFETAEVKALSMFFSFSTLVQNYNSRLWIKKLSTIFP